MNDFCTGKALPELARRTLPVLFLSMFALGCQASASKVVAPSATLTAAPAAVSDGLVDIGGTSLHIHCLGSGTPSVVLEAGLGNDGSIWGQVQSEVGRVTRTCVYDRAGTGYSTAAHRPHGNRQMARELHALLERAGNPGAYVLVGHSMGGANVRLFASEHPDELAGMVLVDAVGDEQFSRWFVLLPDAMKTEFRENLPKLPEGLDFDTYVAGIADMAASSRSIGARPLVVLSHGQAEPPPPGTSAELQARMDKVWADMQRQLCHLSTNCVQVTDPKSGHFIQVDDPALVVASIREVVDAARARRRVNDASLKSAAQTP